MEVILANFDQCLKMADTVEELDAVYR